MTEKTLVKYLFSIEEYFDRSMEELIFKNDCLPYLAQIDNQFAYVIDYTRRIPDTFEQCKQIVQPALNELVIRGMFTENKQIKAYIN